jgi:putative transposase
MEPNEPIWQAKFYDFNVFTERKLQEKLDYMHLNPVRKRLASRVIDWKWSSARWYAEHKPVGVTISVPPGVM